MMREFMISMELNTRMILIRKDKRLAPKKLLPILSRSSHWFGHLAGRENIAQWSWMSGGVRGIFKA